MNDQFRNWYKQSIERHTYKNDKGEQCFDWMGLEDTIFEKLASGCPSCDWRLDGDYEVLFNKKYPLDKLEAIAEAAKVCVYEGVDFDINCYEKLKTAVDALCGKDEK